MQAGALRPYEDSLRTGASLSLCGDSGLEVPLAISRWRSRVDADDQTVLERCVGPVLDVGCGPGRFVAALVERGVETLGIDIAGTAVSMTRRRGLPVLQRNVFGPVPDEGGWGTVLLLDGNIGIDGDPVSLLRRARTLVTDNGRVVVETHSDAAIGEVLSARFKIDGRPIGRSFAWAHVGLDPLRHYAREGRLQVQDTWTSGGRSFAILTP
jgi:SAM-dependent methyltransferase